MSTFFDENERRIAVVRMNRGISSDGKLMVKKGMFLVFHTEQFILTPSKLISGPLSRIGEYVPLHNVSWNKLILK